VLDNVERDHQAYALRRNREPVRIRAHYGNAARGRNVCPRLAVLEGERLPAELPQHPAVPASRSPYVERGTRGPDVLQQPLEQAAPLGIPPVPVLEACKLLDLFGKHGRQTKGSQMLSVVIPCFNEEAVLPKLINRLRTVLDSLGEPYEAILVDDGSRDATASLLIAHQAVWPQLVVRVLSTNAGHQAALTAGLDVASGDLVVTMDDPGHG
jgi:hypothetical protein